MRARLAVAAVLALLASCVTKPADPFLQAERALQRRDLAQALRALDGVPVEHARFPQARALALDVERQMRRGHEMILEGLLLRSEWRDEAALVVLRRAAEVWPELPGLDVLMHATEHRLQLFGGTAASGGDTPRTAAEPAAALDPAAATAAVPQIETKPVTDPSPMLVSEPPSVPSIEMAPTRSVVLPQGADPVSSGLIAVERRLGEGQLEDAVLQLLELARRFPDDGRVRLRLVRLLHQRALLRYGQGAVASAIIDWRRVVELDPDHAPARAMLRAAEAERR